jgi:hypothetical protein
MHSNSFWNRVLYCATLALTWVMEAGAIIIYVRVSSLYLIFYMLLSNFMSLNVTKTL